MLILTTFCSTMSQLDLHSPASYYTSFDLLSLSTEQVVVLNQSRAGIEMKRIEPGAAGREARILRQCYASTYI